MDVSLPRVNPGDTITTDHINSPNKVLEQTQIKIGADSGFGYSESDHGINLWVTDQDISLWAEITGQSGSAYSWLEQEPAASGGWSNGNFSGTTSSNQAYEVNGSTTVPTGKIVRLTFSESLGVWSFPYGACS
jgi:hypothetical protein